MEVFVFEMLFLTEGCVKYTHTDTHTHTHTHVSTFEFKALLFDKLLNITKKAKAKIKKSPVVCRAGWYIEFVRYSDMFYLFISDTVGSNTVNIDIY